MRERKEDKCKRYNVRESRIMKELRGKICLLEIFRMKEKIKAKYIYCIYIGFPSFKAEGN